MLPFIVVLFYLSLVNGDSWLNGTFVVAEVDQGRSSDQIYYFIGATRVVFAADVSPPRANSRVSLLGIFSAPSRFLCREVFEHHKRANEDGLVAMPFEGNFSVRVIIVDTPSTRNTCTEELVEEFMLDQKYSVSNFFREISFGKVNISIASITRVEIFGDHPPRDGDFSACHSLFIEAMSLAGFSPHQDLLLLPHGNSDCANGISYVDCWPCTESYYGGSAAFVGEKCDGVGITVHELLHAFGLFHSDTMDEEGSRIPYADGSCQMGSTTGGAVESLNRKGVSAAQLLRLNVLPENQKASGAEPATIDLASLYSDDEESLKVYQLGNEVISFRSSYDFGIDAHVNATSWGLYKEAFNPRGFASYSDTVYLHRLPMPEEDIGPLLICAIQVGETCVTGSDGFGLRFYSLNETHARIGLINGVPSDDTDSQESSMFPYILATPDPGDETGVTIEAGVPKFLHFSLPELAKGKIITAAALSLATVVREDSLTLSAGCEQGTFSGPYRVRDEIELDVTQALMHGHGNISIVSDSSFRFLSGNDCHVGGLLGDYKCGPRVHYQVGMRGDVTGDNHCNLLDTLKVISHWGPCPCCKEDINSDGKCDLMDILAILDGWN